MKQIKINKFAGIDKRPFASDNTFNIFSNINTDMYPFAGFGVVRGNVTKQCTYSALSNIWCGAYSLMGTTTPASNKCDMAYTYNSVSKLSLTYADKNTALTTIEADLPLNTTLTKAGRMYYDLTNKNVFYTTKENGTATLKEKSLTDATTFGASAMISLDNSTAGTVIIKLYELRQKAYFSENDNITLSCTDWSNNSTSTDASCFEPIDNTETDSKGQATNYVVSTVTIAQDSKGTYTHTYTCTVTGGGGKPFESSFNTVYFGKYSSSKTYAPITIGKRFPNFIDICYYKNRYAGVTKDGGTLMLSAQGDNQQFYDYSGEETDSYYMDFEQGSPFVAVREFNDTLMLFKKDKIHIVSGDYPSNYQLSKTIDNIGCIDKNSICQCNGYLYFLSNDGICAYYGGAVTKIDNIFNTPITSCKAVACGDLLYCLLTLDTNTKVLYAYNTKRSIWTLIYTGLTLIDLYSCNDTLFICDNTTLYYLTYSNNSLSSGQIQSNLIHADLWGKKSILNFKIRGNIVGTVALSIKRDSNSFTTIKSGVESGYFEWDLTVRNIQADYFIYNISVTGYGYIEEIQITIEGEGAKE